MMTTWGWYGTHGGYKAMDLDKKFLSKEEEEKLNKQRAIVAARKAHEEGRQTSGDIMRERLYAERLVGVCPVCHMQRALDGSCSC